MAHRAAAHTRVLQGRPPTRGPSRSAHLERTLLRVHAFILASFAAATLAPLLWTSSPGPVEAAGRLTLVALYVGVAADLLRRGERPLHLVLLLAGMLGPALAVELGHRVGDITAPLAWSALAISALRQLRLVPLGVGMLVAAAAYTLAMAALHGGRLPFNVSDDLLLGVGLALSIAAFAGSLEERTSSADRADEEERARRRADQRRRSEAGAVDEAGRVLHDDVLSSLRLVADGAQRRIDPDLVRESCRASARALREAPYAAAAGGTDPGPLGLPDDPAGDTADDTALDGASDGPLRLGDLLDDLAEQSTAVGTRVTVVVDPDLADLRVPEAGAAALARAAGEALRNVVRHSGTDEADVRALRDDAGRLVVEVSDQGAGFPPDLVEGFGVTRSVREAVAPVGGEVVLTNPADGGATVRVAVPLPPPPEPPVRWWTPEAMRRTHAATVLTPGGSMSLVRAIAWPQGLVWTYLALQHSGLAPRRWIFHLLLLVLVVTTLAVARHLERRPPSAGWLTAVTLVLLVVQCTGLAALPPGGMLDHRSWVVGFVSVPLMLLCLFLPRPTSVLVLAPHVLAVVVASELDPALTLGVPPLGSLNAVLLTPVLGIVLGTLLRRTGRQVAAEHARASLSDLVRARRRAALEVTAQHLEHSRHVVAPWLEEVADDRRGLDDPDTVSTARMLSLEVRDDLYARGLFGPVLRGHVREARRRGAVVEVGAGFAPGAADRATGTLLRDLVPRLPAGAKLTVASRDGRVRMSLVPADAALVRRAVELDPDGLVVDVDDFRAVLRYDDSPDALGGHVAANPPEIRGVAPGDLSR